MAQVTLVAHQHDDNVAVGVVPQLLQPSLHVLVGQVLSDVVDQESADGAAVVPAAAQKALRACRGFHNSFSRGRAMETSASAQEGPIQAPLTLT